MTDVPLPEFTEADLTPQDTGVVQDHHFAPPAPDRDVHPYGVAWSGPWEEKGLSFDQVGRRMVRALWEAHMPASLSVTRPERGLDVDQQVRQELGCSINEEAAREQEELGMARSTVYNLDGPLSASFRTLLATIHHATPTERLLRSFLYPDSYRVATPAQVRGMQLRKVIFTVFETDRVSPGVADLVKRFGQVWVPCRRNQISMVESGVPAEIVHVVPHPIPASRVAQLRATKKAAKRGFPADQVLFYHIGKWEPRKNQYSTLRAFLRAFSPGDPVRFLLKTSRFGEYEGYPKSPAEAIERLCEDPEVKGRGWSERTLAPVVKVNSELLTEGEMLYLHGLGDVYVNASHGEAWDLPSYDALVAGNNLIHTGYGGSEDYAPTVPRLWDGKTTQPAHPGYRWGQARWATVDEDVLVHHMREAARVKLGSLTYSEHPSFEVGQMARALILRLCNLTEEQVHAFPLRLDVSRTDPLRHERSLQGR